MSDKFQELMKEFSKDPEKAQELVEKHEWTRGDLKKVKRAYKTGRFVLPKAARVELKRLIGSIEDQLAKQPSTR